jgi:hypothetical protein
MSGFERSQHTIEDLFMSPSVLREERVAFIDDILGMHEASDCRGARKVHVLYPADLKSRFLQQWRLVDFPEPERLFMEHKKRLWVNGEQAAGWVISGGAKFSHRDPGYNGYGVGQDPKNVLLLSDASYMTAVGSSNWLEDKGANRLVVPDEYLRPLTPADTSLDLAYIAEVLWKLLPTEVRHGTTGITGQTS